MSNTMYRKHTITCQFTAVKSLMRAIDFMQIQTYPIAREWETWS